MRMVRDVRRSEVLECFPSGEPGKPQPYNERLVLWFRRRRQSHRVSDIGLELNFKGIKATAAYIATARRKGRAA